VALVVVLLAGAFVAARAVLGHHPAGARPGGTAGGSPTPAVSRTRAPQGSPLSPGWRGDGKPVTLAFGGDVHFEGELGVRLADDPATALDGTIAELLSGADLSMTNFESALLSGPCTDPQPKQFVFYAPQTAITAFKAAHITLVSEANNHGEDCGRPGLAESLAIAKAARYPIIGIGANAAQAFAPYRTTINGQRIAIIAATEVIDSDLQEAWTATATQPGLASAYQEGELIAAVQAARKDSDTVIVFLHWGTETQQCPNTIQPPLAKALVRAGADIVVGAHAHVQLGAGYLGTAFVDYGLGNLAFYDTTPPETYSGALHITVTGRHIDGYSWRPALIENGLPVPQTGATAAAAIQRWRGLRSCAGLSLEPTTSMATSQGETDPFPGPTITALPDPPGTAPGTTKHEATVSRDG
jgi:Bacterial capsule synthesis protein PGA_cap